MKGAGLTSTDNGRNQMRRVLLSHGSYGRHIIKDFVGVRKGFEGLGKRHWQLHATKGWRNYRPGDAA